ncbi:MAG: (Na+)-NQR maturation NqrM [[Actinobacillus] rossii]|uniref:Protein of uncharacterized function (DUF539) n=1 Tax=[Actinobacillus] rossii TaxID=123820 RepID=A0A380TLS3_9PAST|nr:(Na+)-NQR maturation NqrM [[Actinobacillus] rossii]MDD7425926.1 (Na+)-NQR maturation NqrM [[Actinobacillus] rossii]MDD7570138.1 (Na+)-NQR maturation NqrM [[Actinobacillus] rossii]MDY3124898.1 (Na+)-NQR maturation NqrM [[Actinobacillus] rossii]MDY4506501.1 (Na+)-NQR maturation NqrM [[Actinobacillus] rossii]
MKLFIITFGIFLLVILGMAIGYIVKKKSIKGSCGGITALGMKKMCDCEEPCDNLKDKVAKGEADPSELDRFKKEAQFYEVK